MNIDDVVDANVLVLTTTGRSGRCSTSAAERPVTTKEFADIVMRQYGSDRAAKVTGEYRFGDTRHILSDISALRKLGWEPRRTPADSVARTPSGWRASDGLDGVLDQANAQMRALGVVRKAGASEGVPARRRDRQPAAADHRHHPQVHGDDRRPAAARHLARRVRPGGRG